MPRKNFQGAVLGFFPSLTKLMKLVSDQIYLAYIMKKKKCLSVTNNSQGTLSYLKLNRP